MTVNGAGGMNQNQMHMQKMQGSGQYGDQGLKSVMQNLSEDDRNTLQNMLKSLPQEDRMNIKEQLKSVDFSNSEDYMQSLMDIFDNTDSGQNIQNDSLLSLYA